MRPVSGQVDKALSEEPPASCLVCGERVVTGRLEDKDVLGRFTTALKHMPDHTWRIGFVCKEHST